MNRIDGMVGWWGALVSTPGFAAEPTQPRLEGVTGFGDQRDEWDGGMVGCFDSILRSVDSPRFRPPASPQSRLSRGLRN